MTRPHRPLPASSTSTPSVVESGVPRIAVDLLGGDGAPAVVVDGALQACSADPDLHLFLVGPKAAVDEVVTALAGPGRDRVVGLAVTGAVGMADPPIRAMRPDTTLRAGADALADGRAHALVSAGATGAVVTVAGHVLGRLPGVRRPALAALVPTLAGPVVLLDVGAGVDPTPPVLVGHAVLGAGYAGVAAGIEAPRVGLLSIGAEPGKGDRLRQAAGPALRAARLPAGARYVGPVEGNDVARGGPAEVVVTDGFTGNVLLKGIEGAYALAGHGEPPATTVPRAAALLGVNGTVVVCHGAASAADIASGIMLAARLYRLGTSARLAAVTRESLVEER